MRMDERELVVELHHVQMEKKCLVVIDDIWQIDHWDILSAAFPIAEAGCKVLLTTQNEKIVAEECIYRLKFLTEDQGWELLQKIALPEDYVQVVPTELQELEKIGREVIHKCGCLPLAISVMGGILRDKQSLGEWKKVNENFDTYVQYGEGTEKERRVAHVLDLSYEVLPYYLKPCFLYLGCYGEDEDIDVKKLLLEWIGEGMIHNETQGREETLTDVAERYLRELASRCLVQVTLKEFPSMYHKLKSCRLHDLMRDLCLSKAKEEGFLESMDIYQESCDTMIAKTRRLAIRYQGDFLSDVYGPEIVENLRCLLLINKTKSSFGMSYHHLIYNLNIFTSLKILLIVNCDLDDQLLPRDIGNKLIHLKYLGLRDCSFDELPSSLSNLQRLQTLEVKPKCDYKLPVNVIYKMKSLRHLFLKCRKSYDDLFMEQRVRLDGLNELETFEHFNAEYFNFKDIMNMKNLRRFKASIFETKTLSMIVNYISSNQNNLRETILKIVDCDLRSEECSIILRKMLESPSLCRVKVDGRIDRLPSIEPHQLCPRLVDLTLSCTRIEDDPMEILEKLPMLKRLRLKEEAYVGCKMICRAFGFRQLSYLSLRSLPNLKEWIVEEGAAPKLSTLRISECTTLEMIPDGLRFVTTLQKLEIVCMPQEFMDRLQRLNIDDQQGQDYEKVRHVSSIVYAGFDYSKPDFNFSFLKGTEFEKLAYI